MLDLHIAWSAFLTLFLGAMGFFVKEKFSELTRITILLNRTREEAARDLATKAEVDKVTLHIDQRFNRLEAKIDQLIQARK